MDLNKWNIKYLLDLQLQVNTEIYSRIKTIEKMENSFLTYNPNGKAEDYKALMQAGLDLLRHGVKND